VGSREEVTAQRRAVIRAMVSSVMRGEQRDYLISVVGYYLEGLLLPGAQDPLTRPMAERWNIPVGEIRL
jgi:hypothetical protein